MPVLIDEIITVQFFLFCAVFTSLSLWALVKFKVLTSWIDPSIIPFFQILITCLSLGYLSILPLSQIIAFLIFILLLLWGSKVRVKPIRLISESFWRQFSYFLLIIIVVANVYVTMQKGFIFAVEDAAEARLVYYQGYGLLQRVNFLGAPILIITSFYYLKSKQRLSFFVYLIIGCYLLITLGSKQSLTGVVFMYGAFYYFSPESERARVSRNKLKIFLLIPLLSVSMLGMFYLIYKEEFINAFIFRLISFSDGPFYFYLDHLDKYISYSPMYMFDEFFVALRVHPNLQYMGLGAKINYYYYDYYDLLNGPNPQIFVESKVMFGSFFWVMYLTAAFLFVFLRKWASTPYSFYFLSGFASTFFIDSQYAFYLVFTFMLLGLLMIIFAGLKYIVWRYLKANQRVVNA